MDLPADPEATERLWALIQRPYEPSELVEAMLGIDRTEVRQLIGATLATSPAAEALLGSTPRLLRKLVNTTTTRPERVVGSIRGPVLWSETISARASSNQNPDVFVCASPARDFDVEENRVLVAALGVVRDAGRAVDGVAASLYDDAELRRARRNAELAARLLTDGNLRWVGRRKGAKRPAKPDSRSLARTRNGSRSARYRPALDMLELVDDPFQYEHVVHFCDRRTLAQHAVLMEVHHELESRNIEMPPYRAWRGFLFSGHLQYHHPRARGDRSRLHGIQLHNTLIDVPESLLGDSRQRASEDLEQRAGGRPCALVMTLDDVPAAVDLALSNRFG
ncbi:MAG: hypothetical protein GY929_12710 [Actinomycetia bacterium]|nr:hypothetical protein [Actinomycetes bacterium]